MLSQSCPSQESTRKPYGAIFAARSRIGITWSVAPSNARPEAMKAADYVTKTHGGRGLFREVVETILRRQGRWAKVRAAYEKGASKGMF